MIYKAGEYIPAGPPNRKNQMKKIIQTKQQRENTLDALNVMWPSVPPENVLPYLFQWRRDYERTRPNCGTVACFGGWCAWWPDFVKQGVFASATGEPLMVGFGESDDVAKLLFGNRKMFAIRYTFPSDDSFKGSDHALITRRLQWLLLNSKVAK